MGRCWNGKKVGFSVRSEHSTTQKATHRETARRSEEIRTQHNTEITDDNTQRNWKEKTRSEHGTTQKTSHSLSSKKRDHSKDITENNTHGVSKEKRRMKSTCNLINITHFFSR